MTRVLLVLGAIASAALVAIGWALSRVGPGERE